MAQAGRPKAALELTDDERATLRRWARRPKSLQALALRSRIVLACADGLPNTKVAEQLGVNKVTVGKWRARFVEHRLEGLTDEPRPGAPRTVTDDLVEAVIVKTLESRPANATHWSTRSMAEATGMSQSAVSRIWRAFGLKPHKQEAFRGAFGTCASRARHALARWSGGGELDGIRVLNEHAVSEAVRASTNGEIDAFIKRPVGWAQGFQIGGPGRDPRDLRRVIDGSGGTSEMFGHAGNASCTAWADPSLDLVFIYLSSVRPAIDDGIRHLGEVSDALRAVFAW
jgi:transposase